MEDRVVREYDVYVSTELQLSGSTLCLLSQPLRPPWRPYDHHAITKMQYKPNAKRLEIEVPLETDASTYNQEAPDERQIKSITLRSTAVDPQVNYAVGVVKDGALVLAPLDQFLQLRPAMNFVGAELKPEGDKPAEEQEEEEEAGAKAIEVQIKKRETERQQQARLNSYAYLVSKEAEEAWKPLTNNTPDSSAAAAIRCKYLVPKEGREYEAVARPAYLKTVVPTSAQEAADASSADDLLPGALVAAKESLDAAATAALPAAVKALFEKHSVCNMANVRSALSESADAAKDAASLGDRQLHEALLATGLVVCIKKVYVMAKAPKPDMDPFRNCVLELLKDKDSVKRVDITKHAELLGIAVTDSLYNRVVKDLCVSRGTLWQIKSGADM